MHITQNNFISELKSRREQALEFVIDEYGWIVKTVVSRHLSQMQSLQEDCINEIFISVWEHIDSFDATRSTFQNWIAGISKFKAIDYLRKYQKEWANCSIDQLEIADKDTCLEKIVDSQLSKQWEELLNCLKKEDRELFTKLYLEEKQLSQVSKETGMKKELIYNRISRGKKKLRQLFPLISKNGGDKI